MVTVIGLALAFLANAISPLGLSLRRNYFPNGTNAATSAPAPAPAKTKQTAAGGNPSNSTDTVAARLQANGLQVADHDEAVELFHDPRCAQGLIVFIDARDPDHFRAGHIPGAFEYDSYRPDQYLGTVLPACHAAEKIVVYCNGGDCEDSQFAAITLREAGIANEKLYVYEGGITDWTQSSLPIEIGKRNSGQIRNADNK